MKRQAPKVSRRNLGAGGEDGLDDDSQRPDPTFVRWVSTKEGSVVGVPEEVVQGPVGRLFAGKPGGGFTGRKMVEEVS